MIKIYKASENNLKKINVYIPLNKITAITGISGSGKSSLIFNILAKESSRLERIDSGVAKRLDFAIRPDFEKISNLPYSVVLKQRGLSESISSTIATITGLHELLRNEFVQNGKIIGLTGNEIKEPNINDIEAFILKFYPKNTFKYYAVVVDKKFTDGIKEMSFLLKNGIKEAIFISSFDCKDKIKKLNLSNPLNIKYSHTILLPIPNLSDLKKFEHLALCNFLIDSPDISLRFNTDFFDIDTGIIYQKKSSHLLSFNSTNDLSGKCCRCNGRGYIQDIDIDNLILSNVKMSGNFLNLEMNNNGCYKYILLCRDSLDSFLKKKSIPMNEVFHNLSDNKKQLLIKFIFDKILKHQNKPSIGKFIKDITCPECNGTRLNYKANSIKLFDHNISALLKKTVDETYSFLVKNKLKNKKILSILDTLRKSTLGYLSLDRCTTTLSGGELQRLKFSMEINSEYKNLLYILDEPSTALHKYNNSYMIQLIKELRDKGNTVIISDHNLDYIQESDHIIELGPGSGKNGGNIIYEGKPKKLNNLEFQRKKIIVNLENSLKLTNVNINNIISQDFIVPLNCLVTISGVSGSGKSSLIHDALIPCIKQYLSDKTFNTSIIEKIKNIDKIKNIAELTQSQIGINSRSIVATYLNIFDDIREVYSSLDSSKSFGLNKSHFSFNTELGACTTCKGLGEIEYNLCSSCLGQRYKPEILSIEYHGLNIYDLLNSPLSEITNLTISEKTSFAINILYKLGLSHIQLGRVTSTLSGGEAQRIKLAKILIDSFKNIEKGGYIFIFDEPTTGLNDKDLLNLYKVFFELLMYKNSIVVIEHNLEIIKNSDFIIDIGLGSGINGGKNIFSGSYQELIKNKESITAKSLNNTLPKQKYIVNNYTNLKEKTYQNKREPDCNKFYWDEKHFQIERDFYKNYTVKTDNNNHYYFKNKKDLFLFVNSLNSKKISFNPYTTDLFKYNIVPKSIKKERIANLISLGFNLKIKDASINEWDFRVETNDLEQAYNFGNGWITVLYDKQQLELFTRLVSIDNRIIGSSRITTKTFNLYCNGCSYCNSNGYMNTYDYSLIINNPLKSILCDGFFKIPLKLHLKGVIDKYRTEGLFDFSKPYSELTLDEKNIFIFGFNKYYFLKPNGKPTTQSDYIYWRGLNNYIQDYLNNTHNDKIIKGSLHLVPCPFCSKGFNNEVNYYKLGMKNITDYLL